eukprot:TRINITY_DN8229_c0_g1_i1.p1 TRINITY_DN8229_c0_g1~~TRINITY_DN8229_c0_g1_i1.p1  ORF type:complete len:750 (+),score=220.64 TRINITY_DN8229_c0_g1_i1:103-2352(+)
MREKNTQLTERMKQEERNQKRQQKFVVLLEQRYREVCTKTGVPASLTFSRTEDGVQMKPEPIEVKKRDPSMTDPKLIKGTPKGAPIILTETIRRSTDTKDAKDAKDSKDPKAQKDLKDSKDLKDPKDSKDPKGKNNSSMPQINQKGSNGFFQSLKTSVFGEPQQVQNPKVSDDEDDDNEPIVLTEAKFKELRDKIKSLRHSKRAIERRLRGDIEKLNQRNLQLTEQCGEINDKLRLKESEAGGLKSKLSELTRRAKLNPMRKNKGTMTNDYEGYDVFSEDDYDRDSQDGRRRRDSDSDEGRRKRRRSRDDNEMSLKMQSKSFKRDEQGKRANSSEERTKRRKPNGGRNDSDEDNRRDRKKGSLPRRDSDDERRDTRKRTNLQKNDSDDDRKGARKTNQNRNSDDERRDNRKKTTLQKNDSDDDQRGGRKTNVRRNDSDDERKDTRKKTTFQRNDSDDERKDGKRKPTMRQRDSDDDRKEKGRGNKNDSDDERKGGRRKTLARNDSEDERKGARKTTLGRKDSDDERERDRERKPTLKQSNTRGNLDSDDEAKRRNGDRKKTVKDDPKEKLPPNREERGGLPEKADVEFTDGNLFKGRNNVIRKISKVTLYYQNDYVHGLQATYVKSNGDTIEGTAFVGRGKERYLVKTFAIELDDVLVKISGLVTPKGIQCLKLKTAKGQKIAVGSIKVGTGTTKFKLRIQPGEHPSHLFGGSNIAPGRGQEEQVLCYIGGFISPYKAEDFGSVLPQRR